MSHERVTVLVADDHPIYREGIVRAIKDRPELELVGEAGDGRQALEQVRRLTPQVAVLDIRMPGLDGTQVLAAMRREGCAPRFSSSPRSWSPSSPTRRSPAGAKGYLSKESSRQEVCEAIVTIARGGTALAAQAQAGLAEQIQERERSGGPPQLTPREQEVLSWSPRATRRRTSASTSTSRRRPSRATCTRSTRSSASPTAPPPSPRRMRRGMLE